MSAWIIPPIQGFAEPSIAPEFYVDGIGGIEIINGNVRIYLIAEQSPLSPGAAHKIVTVKLVGPLLNLPQVIGQLAQCLWRPAREAVPQRGCSPHLVP